MNLEQLKERRNELQMSLQNLQQSYHIVTGHLQEIDFLIQEMMKDEQKPIETCEEVVVE